jgi:hypothetical protein
MKKVQRWRYYCGFCKKSGGSGAAMHKHEMACTLNPGRVCGICSLMGEATPAMAEMLALLPDPTGLLTSMESEQSLCDAVEAAMPALRELANNCPACIMAALRIKGIPVPMVDSFDYKKEFAARMADMAEAQKVTDDLYNDFGR